MRLLAAVVSVMRPARTDSLADMYRPRTFRSLTVYCSSRDKYSHSSSAIEIDIVSSMEGGGPSMTIRAGIYTSDSDGRVRGSSYADDDKLGSDVHGREVVQELRSILSPLCNRGRRQAILG